MRFDEAWDKSRTVHGFMGSKQQGMLMYSIASQSKACAEIGSFYGRSSILVGLAMLGHGKYYCIDTYNSENKELHDTYGNTYDAWVNNIKHFNLSNTCIPVVGFSTDDKVIAEVPNELDFVYVDGAHDSVSTLMDIRIWSKKIKRGGLMLFHDYIWNSVSVAIQHAGISGIIEEIADVDDFGICRVISDETH